MPRLIRMAASLAAAAFIPAVAQGQLGSPNPLPGPQGTFAITNARIVTVSGAAIDRGTLVISGGKITAVGAGAAVPQGAQVIDGTGLSVYPGMMDAGTSMGLNEIPQGANATVDDAEVGSFNPNSIAYYGINPHSAHIGVTRVVGVTHVLSSPTGGIVSGQSTMANLAGWTPAAMTIQQKAGLVITLPRAGGGGFGFGGGGGFGGGAAAPGNALGRVGQMKGFLVGVWEAPSAASVRQANDATKALDEAMKQAEALLAKLPGVNNTLKPSGLAITLP